MNLEKAKTILREDVEHIKKILEDYNLLVAQRELDAGEDLMRKHWEEKFLAYNIIIKGFTK